MNPAILWLVRLGIDQGPSPGCKPWPFAPILKNECELIDFAQKLLDDGHVDNVAELEKLADLAMTKADAGPPPGDPFKLSMPTAAAVAAASGAPSAPAAASASTAAAEPAAAAAPRRPAGHGEPNLNIKFPFDQIEAMDASSLAAAFRELLRATGRAGASDLHISTGTRPFVRKDRALTYISEHVLTAEDTLSLNTVLLNKDEKKIFLEKKDLDYALGLDAGDRYRVNLMFHKNGTAARTAWSPPSCAAWPSSVTPSISIR